jgi:asparaginyl-tRNA synthetase
MSKFINLKTLRIRESLDSKNLNNIIKINGWVRTVRSSSSTLAFCNINDGSNVNGIQVIIEQEIVGVNNMETVFSKINTGIHISCIGIIVESPAKGQLYEMKLLDFEIVGTCDINEYPLSKTKMNLDTLRGHIHLRPRTSVFGSIFRIRSTLMKSLHDFYHNKNFLHLDPNIITTNECEGGAGVFQVTENDITELTKLPIKDNKYDWSKDHFNCPTFLTVSSQLQLETLACSLGNVYTMNKSFRSEHSSTSKHVSEFTHLEIEMINNKFEDLMDISEEMIKYTINDIKNKNLEDLENLNKFVSKGILEKLENILTVEYKRIRYSDLIIEINDDIINKKLKLDKINNGDDLSSQQENYITEKYNAPVFVTHWPIDIKSFYMKQCDDNYCESFDLLMPYGIGELIGSSQREDDYNKLKSMMIKKNVNIDDMSFYLDLRKYGSCPHGGFGLGVDRLLMLITGISNIKDVIPFPVFYKSCKY